MAQSGLILNMQQAIKVKLEPQIPNNIIDSIVKTNRKKIIIIGPSDTGKSTLTLFIANKLISMGFQPLIIDSDIGQGELAPPTCIGENSNQTNDRFIQRSTKSN